MRYKRLIKAVANKFKRRQVMDSCFMEKLSLLCDEYKAEFSHTEDDDGIHISLDGNEVFAGFLPEEGADRKLREALKYNELLSRQTIQKKLMVDGYLMSIGDIVDNILSEDDEVLSLAYNDDTCGFQIRIRFGGKAVLSASISTRNGIEVDRVEKVISMMIDTSKSWKPIPKYIYCEEKHKPRKSLFIKDEVMCWKELREPEYRPNYGEGSW